MKLAVFDFDSTLMDGETLEFLANNVGIRQRVKDITDRAMNGELDFFESLQERVFLLKGLKVETVNEICGQLPMMNGADVIVNKLQSAGYKVVCFSGGFKNATVPFVKKLGLDAEFSNTFHSKHGVLTGFVGGEMMFNNSKGVMLQKLQNILGISAKDTLVVGDGANDLSMFEYAALRVAFCAKPVLKEKANVIIEEKDLSLILDKI